ncbi:hypothetical protein BPTFM16_01865 [Altererythrobacter insulae]|nr:hypothetical protein BPTFM16_01865 [Altererythrobacter insulae]
MLGALYVGVINDYSLLFCDGGGDVFDRRMDVS